MKNKIQEIDFTKKPKQSKFKRFITKPIHKLSRIITKPIDVPCGGYQTGTPTDGYEYDCDYYYDGEHFIECDECVCNYGNYNPLTGKRINWLLQRVQYHRFMANERYK